MVRSALAIASVLGAALAPVALAGGGPDGPRLGYGPQVQEARAVLYCDAKAAHPAAQRTCLATQLLRLVERTGDPAAELPRIDRYAHSVGGLLLDSCHIIMHSVGQRYAAARRLTLGELNQVLPRSNDPSCSAGFAHGMIIYLGPQLTRAGPRAAEAACARAGTRYRRYSCIHGLGHAYMRLSGERFGIALDACKGLGPVNAPDCAQGVFHDYWITLGDRTRADVPWGAGSATQIAYQLCSRYPYVRGCWYRAFLENHPSRPIRTAADLLAVCRGMRGLNHEACLTAGALVSSSDPFTQVRLCRGLHGLDAVDCVRGTAVAALEQSPLSEQVELAASCRSFDAAARPGCYRWLGKALAVVTNGGFLRTGCARLGSGAADCRRGAALYNGALVTFS
jgi:hypothetical protein